LFRGSLNEALNAVRQFKLKVDTDTKPQEMDLACSEEEGSWATAYTSESSAQDGITPLFGTRRGNDILLQRKVGDLVYSVTASVFFQANDFMISELVSHVLDAANRCGTGAALDLFSGVGLFSLPLARRFESVTAVENSPAATRLCSRNAAGAAFQNIKVVCADVSEWLQSQPGSARGSFDLIVLDPPRAGAGPDVMKQISRLAPPRIIYVSCDPQTLVRDLTAISPSDYKIAHVEGLDLFPQTYHFESVVQLARN
jgi:23S rRNA (uracil1939-C5)-methyltransferase